jgi:hypothetical protein
MGGGRHRSFGPTAHADSVLVNWETEGHISLFEGWLGLIRLRRRSFHGILANTRIVYNVLDISLR